MLPAVEEPGRRTWAAVRAGQSRDTRLKKTTTTTKKTTLLEQISNYSKVIRYQI